ncbi:hypothetical protein BDV93DRAFT_607090 [Ceratobasidium sp. AG-I]|nr:hypothetical protein BDV93DRAFT_607090 [Ceratobasidium sp. AG-I]
MFGESDFESPPRLSSPWEVFSPSNSPSPGLSTSSSPVASSSDIEAELSRRLLIEVPRLAPEIEEGNVEYKLKLSPSPERLTRLITQLKWRLLEGGGQALYEIGVGDKGQLIGLPRREMDGSLDALERMAGELGATVMILKEIIVPKAALLGGADEIADDGTPIRGKCDLRNDHLAPPGGTPTSWSSSTSGSGSSDDLDAFSLELDHEDGDKPTLPLPWSAKTYPPSTTRADKPQKPLTGRGAKLAHKAEHKKIRRAVKRGVNASYATNLGTSPTASLDMLLGPDVSTVIHANTIRGASSGTIINTVPPALGVPQVIVDAPEALSLDSQTADPLIVPFEPQNKFPPNPDEVIIVEALVVRKLALEEAFLDFGGFSVLG